MFSVANFARCCALVKTAVVGLYGGHVQVGDDLVGASRKVTDLNPEQNKGKRKYIKKFRLLILVLNENLSDEVIFLPSSSQLISGRGFPEAEHLRETLGPGCMVRSAKVDRN